MVLRTDFMETTAETKNTMTNLVEIRCSCGRKGRLLGKVQTGAVHEHKCPRCGAMIAGIAIEIRPGGCLKKGDTFTFEGIKAPRRLGEKRRALRQYKVIDVR